MPTEFSANLSQETCPWRVLHLLRPAEGGMRAQVASLLQAAPKGEALLAAPPDVLHSLGCAPTETFPLPEKIGGGKEQLQNGAAAGQWGRRKGATLLHAHGLRWLPLYGAAQIRSGLPLVITLHNMVPPPSELSLKERLALKVGLSRASRIIAVSDAVAASVSPTVPGAVRRVCVIRNGIDLSRFSGHRNPAARAAVRKSLGLPSDSVVVICVARLSPEKNLGILLEVTARLIPSLPTLRLLLVGDGPWRPTLLHQAHMLGITDRVTFAGMRTDIPALLAASDLFCLPSRTEGLGIAAIEAMAAGLPAVVSRVGGLPEVVEDGVTGLLTPPGDQRALADSFAALLNDPARAGRMGEAGRLRAACCFDSRTMITATHEVYEAVAASSGKHR